MDNIIIVTEEYDVGLNGIKSSISCLNDIETKLRNIESLSLELGIDISEIQSKTKIINKELEELYSKLSNVNAEMAFIDSSASSYFKSIDKSETTKQSNKETNEEKLDELKGSNKNTGALISMNSLNIFGELKDIKNVSKILDKIKVMGGFVESEKSINTKGIMATKEGINILLDSIKNTGNSGSKISKNVVSILKEEM